MPPPDLTAVQAYLASVGQTSTNAEVTDALAAEKGAQARVCRVPDDAAEWPPDLDQALKRRVHRNLFMRGLPSGLQTAASEAAVATVRVGSDPETRRLEAPWRRVTLG